MARDERGVASVMVVALTGVLLLLGLAGGFVTAGAAAHRRAQSAADLAALSAATVLQQGAPACPTATRVAARNGARTTGCRVEAEDVLVEVEVDSPELLGHTWEIRGRARAGPGPPA